MDFFTTQDLLALGLTERQIRAAVSGGTLIRARRGHFARPDADRATLDAVRVGGALACVSELRHRGIWVLDAKALHVRVAPHASRLRLTGRLVRLHWGQPVSMDPDPAHVATVSALAQAFDCLDERSWVASIDSALHLGSVTTGDLERLRALVPKAARDILRLADRRAESGLESIVRVLAIQLGFRVRSQVRIAGVGRVDLIVEDWVVVETDGTAFHDQALSPRDRRRDAHLFAGGRSVLRPGYSLVVWDPATVARQLIGAVAAHRRVANSGRIVARARRRLVTMKFS